jgi:cell division septum initiation protein DivIVA
MNAEEQEYMDYLIHNRRQLTNQNTKLLDEIEVLQNRLEVSEKEHYKTLQQLAIATKALIEYAGPQIWGMDGFCYKDGSIAEQALKEIDLVGTSVSLAKEEV